MNEIDRRMAELQNEIDKLKREQEMLQSLSPAQRVAETLHKKLCYHDHTDQCGWYYSKWGEYLNANNVRARYLTKAENILRIVGEDTALKIIEVL